MRLRASSRICTYAAQAGRGTRERWESGDDLGLTPTDAVGSPDRGLGEDWPGRSGAEGDARAGRLNGPRPRIGIVGNGRAPRVAREGHGRLALARPELSWPGRSKSLRPSCHSLCLSPANALPDEPRSLLSVPATRLIDALFSSCSALTFSLLRLTPRTAQLITYSSEDVTAAA